MKTSFGTFGVLQSAPPGIFVVAFTLGNAVFWMLLLLKVFVRRLVG